MPDIHCLMAGAGAAAASASIAEEASSAQQQKLQVKLVCVHGQPGTTLTVKGSVTGSCQRSYWHIAVHTANKWATTLVIVTSNDHSTGQPAPRQLKFWALTWPTSPSWVSSQGMAARLLLIAFSRQHSGIPPSQDRVSQIMAND